MQTICHLLIYHFVNTVLVSLYLRHRGSHEIVFMLLPCNSLGEGIMVLGCLSAAFVHLFVQTAGAVLGIFIWVGQSKAKQILSRPIGVVYVGIMGMTRAVWV